jgi:hypothetical protein
MVVVLDLGLVRQAHYKSATYRMASFGSIYGVLDDSYECIRMTRQTMTF